jgi:hypothetical protein
MWIKVDQDSALWQERSFENILAFSNSLKTEIFFIE